MRLASCRKSSYTVGKRKHSDRAMGPCVVVRPRHRKGTLDRGKSRDTSIPEAEAAVVKAGGGGEEEVCCWHSGSRDPRRNRETCFTSSSLGRERSSFLLAEIVSGDNLQFPAGQFFGSIFFAYVQPVTDAGPRNFIFETQLPTPSALPRPS